MNRCALCPNVNACIPADGPWDADHLFIGEAPGYQEDKYAKKAPPGKPFIGKTGDEVNRHYLPLAGLRRDTSCFANAISCLPVSAGGKLDPNRKKDIALLESCANTNLYPLIERGRFKAIIPLGAFACRAVFGEAFDLELKHGFPQDTAWGIPAFPMYHPALGIHEPKKMLYIRTDWQRLRSYLSGRLVLPSDDYETDYQEITTTQEIDATLDLRLHLACDTESKRGGDPYCFTYSQIPGVGRLIRAERRDLLLYLNGYLAEWNTPILWHNWLYDWAVTDAMGLTFPHRKIVDTMAFVFQLGNLPQGLKALAFRELGMEMEDYDDVVTPHSQKLVLHYYDRARATSWPKPDHEMVIDDKTGLWKLYKPQSMNTKLKRFFTDLSKNAEKDVFGMWEDNWVDQHEMMEAELGPWPGKCISHVPFEKTLFYACRDADALGRLWPVIRRMRSRVRKVSQEHWRN